MNNKANSSGACSTFHKTRRIKKEWGKRLEELKLALAFWLNFRAGWKANPQKCHEGFSFFSLYLVCWLSFLGKNKMFKTVQMTLTLWEGRHAVFKMAACTS